MPSLLAGWRRSLARFAPHAVAAFVVLHLAASCADALPNPGPGMDRRAWREPRVRHELSVWAERVGMERKAFEESLWGIANAWVKIRAAIVSPFRPYLDVSGVRQSWAMFIAGTRHRDRFQIRGRDCGVDDRSCDWRPLYTRNVDGEDWLKPELEHPRLRSATFRWMWPDHTRRYSLSCRNLARRAFADEPALQAMQCRFERSLSPGPGDPDARKKAAPTWGRVFVVERADLEGTAS